MTDTDEDGRGRSRVPTQHIPRLLHFIWVGSAMPGHLAQNVQRWRDLHPTWGLRVWTDRDFRWLHNLPLFNEAESIVPRDAVGQFKADVARYEILLREGGFYADVDTYPLRPIDDSVLKHKEFAVQEDPSWIGNTYLGATPDHPLFREIVIGLKMNAKRFRGKRPNVIAGPKYITPLWRRSGGYVAPTEWGFPYSYSNVKRSNVPATFGKNTYAVHEWQHTRDVMEARHARR